MKKKTVKIKKRLGKGKMKATKAAGTFNATGACCQLSKLACH